MYGRFIIFVSLGISCTVWYSFFPGDAEGLPPLEFLVNREVSYEVFRNVDFHFAKFNKMSYVECRLITDQVLSAFENVYPFKEINIPIPTSINPDDVSNTKAALGLGIIVAVFLTLGMISCSSPPDLSVITSQGFYTLSPLRLRRISSDDLGEFLLATLPDCPDLTFYPYRKSSSYIVVFPSKKEDVLVLMALSIHLYRLTYGSVPKENYRLLDREGLFYSSIQNMGKMTRLYQINMNPYLQLIHESLILDGVKSFVGEDSVCYRLVSSFLHLDTFDEDGRMIDFGCMPTVGEITRVLFNLALMEFDRRLCHKYPGIVFERFIGLVYIACTDDLRIDEYQVWDMIQDLGLSCEIDYTEPGDEPLECRQRMVALDYEGKLWMLSREVVERSLVADKEKKVEPMGPSILALLNTLNPYGLMAVAHRYSVRDFRLLCRLAGAGYRVLARLDHRRPRRYSRLVVMGLKLLSPSYQLDFRLGKGQPLCPEAHGRLVRVLRA
ncbi:hypothetical protein LXL04_040147 [Taraxacum kok-saghyz]